MATVSELIQANATAIGSKTECDTISPADVAGRLNALVLELPVRGMVTAADTTVLQTKNTLDVGKVIVPGVGIFLPLVTAAVPDMVNTFPSPIVGILWNKTLSSGSAYTANEGLSLTVNNFRLGQDVGQAGSPALLLSTREIPLGAFNLHMITASATSGFQFRSNGSFVAGAFNHFSNANVAPNLISPISGTSVITQAPAASGGSGRYAALYADSRFTIADGTTLLTRSPTAHVTGIDNVNTATYLPWNGVSGIPHAFALQVGGGPRGISGVQTLTFPADTNSAVSVMNIQFNNELGFVKHFTGKLTMLGFDNRTVSGVGSTAEWMADITTGRTKEVGDNTLYTNRFALYMMPIKNASVTNAYSIFQEGASDRNYFAGFVEVPNVLNAGANTGKFMVVDSGGVLRYRTAAEMKSDLDIVAGVDTNIANTDLTFTAPRTHNLNGNLLKFTGGTVQVVYDGATGNSALTGLATSTGTGRNVGVTASAQGATTGSNIGLFSYVINPGSGSHVGVLAAVDSNLSLPNNAIGVCGRISNRSIKGAGGYFEITPTTFFDPPTVPRNACLIANNYGEDFTLFLGLGASAAELFEITATGEIKAPKVSIKQPAQTTDSLTILDSSGKRLMSFGNLISYPTISALYLVPDTVPTATNYSLIAAGGIVAMNAPTNAEIRINNTQALVVGNGLVTTLIPLVVKSDIFDRYNIISVQNNAGTTLIAMGNFPSIADASVIYMQPGVVPSTTNYTLAGSASGDVTLNGTVNLSFRVAGFEIFQTAGTYLKSNAPFQMKEMTAALPAPPATFGNLYAKNDGHIWYQNAAGTEFDLTLSAAGVTVLSATSTPVLGPNINVTSVVVNRFSHVRVGNEVYFTGALTVNEASANTDTKISIPLPIPSAFTSVHDASGVVVGFLTGTDGGVIEADPVNLVLVLTYTPGGVTPSHPLKFSGSYTIKP